MFYFFMAVIHFLVCLIYVPQIVLREHANSFKMNFSFQQAQFHVLFSTDYRNSTAFKLFDKLLQYFIFDIVRHVISPSSATS